MDRSGASNRDQLRGIAHRAMAERGLLPDFSTAVIAETETIGKAATDTGPSIRDLRDLLWCSIDNDDSRDLDQLTVTAPMKDGTVKVLVAVADVDALVQIGSAIDGHARANTTSVYTAAEIFPMLPEKLSTDLTSLGPDRPRLAIIIEMVVAADGTVAASDVYRAVVLNRAKELIEDFMIAANGVTAKYQEAKRLPSLRRVLRAPERWGRLVDLAAGLGGHLPAEPDARALEEFLAQRRRQDPVRFPDLSLSVVKLLGSGEYVVERPGQSTDGHFGLATRDYSHSTAPNRRFPDLVTGRLLKASMAGQPAPYVNDDLDGLARHCTEQEDNAAKVERQVQKSAAALLLASRIGEQFDAIVTGASEKGTWVRIREPSVEGKVVRGSQGLDVGDHVRVELVDTDVERGFIDFRRASG